MKLRVRTPNKSPPEPRPQSTPDPKFPPRRRRRRYRNQQKPFVCALCRSRYTRRQTVYDHFSMCVQKNGNPRGVRWDEDVSCWLAGRQSRCEEEPSSRCESVGSGGTVASEEAMRGDDDTEMEDVVEAEGVEMPSSPPRRLLPASVFQRVAEWEPEPVSEQESDLGPAVEVGTGFQQGTEEKRLYPFTVMRIASLVILASKEYASRGVEQVKAVFELWADLDPEVAKPAVEVDEEWVQDASARRIAVGMFANRVFSSCLTEADGRHDGLLALTSGLRDVAAELGAADTVAKIHDLVSLALGDEGPLML